MSGDSHLKRRTEPHRIMITQARSSVRSGTRRRAFSAAASRAATSPPPLGAVDPREAEELGAACSGAATVVDEIVLKY